MYLVYTNTLQMGLFKKLIRVKEFHYANENSILVLK